MTRISISQPPFGYGRIVTLITITPHVMARTSVPTSVASHRREQHAPSYTDDAWQLSALDHRVDRRSGRAEQVGGFVNRQQDGKSAVMMTVGWSR
jgi:hypothetical protein